ncbi:MAG: hypothetical protein PQJ61_14545 [Spirochaetales bacterium]|uniref:Uncharacterized protein n=1 Tax=Candidatus Thalassospirochaeta sargassi TaxID=3119039 RepID=A0AAJ1IJ49_9SPIO|nr:hypothetical protein [Spirochaetales bacterium]
MSKKFKVRCINGIIEEFIVEAESEDEAKSKLFKGEFIECNTFDVQREIRNVEEVQ